MKQDTSHCSKPRWLSKEYFQPLVNRKHPETTIKEISSTDWSAEGNEIVHYFYCLLELLGPSGTQIKSYQVKQPTFEPFSPPCMRKVLDTEVQVLTKIVPVMERILTEISSGEFDRLASTLVDYCGEYIYNIVEDDRNSNFTVLANEKGVDLKHCVLFMKFLAVFHASSIPALKELPEDVLDNPLLTDKEAWKRNEDAIQASLAEVIGQMESWEDGHVWLEKMRRLRVKLPHRYAMALRRRPTRFRVLVHGSPSGQRVLFRDESETPGCCRVRLRGFEFARVGSFADDILHFVYRAAGDDVLESHTDVLVEEYRTAFNETLDLLGLRDERLSAEDVRTELRSQRAVALVTAFHELPHVRTPGYLNAPTDGETQGEVYKCPEYTRLLRTLLAQFDARGWLDGFDNISAEDLVPDSSFLPT